MCNKWKQFRTNGRYVCTHGSKSEQMDTMCLITGSNSEQMDAMCVINGINSEQMDAMCVFMEAIQNKWTLCV